MKFFKKSCIILLIFCFLFSMPVQAAVKTRTSAKTSKAVTKAKTKKTASKKTSSKKITASKTSLQKSTAKTVTASFAKLVKLQKTTLRKTAAVIRQTVQKKEMDVLLQKLRSYISSNGLDSGHWSVYVKNLNTNQSILTYSRHFAAVSTIKLYAMAAAYDKVQKGQLAMTPTLSRLLYNMIAYSDNDSFNYIVSDYVGSQYLNSFIRQIGLLETAQFNGLTPGSHPYSQHNPGPAANYTTAADCGRLLEKIYRGTLVSKNYSNEMLNLLKAQTRRWKIPAGIPSNVVVANKTGESDRFQHDTAIVYGAKTPYIICVFSDQENINSIYHIQTISSLVYQYLNG